MRKRLSVYLAAPDWAVMFILAQEGATYARLCFNVGPRASVEIPTRIDYSAPFEASDQEAWGEEYRENVHIELTMPLVRRGWHADDTPMFPREVPEGWQESWGEYVDGLEEDPITSGRHAMIATNEPV